MALLSVTDVTVNGADLATVDVAADVAGDEFVNTGKEYFYVNNGSGAPITVTFDAAGAGLGGTTFADKAVTVPAGAQRLYGPFLGMVYNDSDGNVNVTYSAVTSVTVGVMRFTKAE